MKNQDQKRSQEPSNIVTCHHCNNIIDYDQLLSTYGPEGLYEIAKKLMQVADQDVANALLDK